MDGRRSFSIFVANFQKSEMRRGLLTGVCLNIKQSHGGLQMVGRLHSRQGLQSGRGAAGKSPFLLLDISEVFFFFSFFPSGVGGGCGCVNPSSILLS